MKRLLIILLIALAHFVLVMVLAAATFEISLFIFGVYPPPSDGGLHQVLTIVLTVLMFPLGLAAESIASGRFLEGVLMIANSVLWALAIYAVAGRVVGMRRHRLTPTTRATR